MKRRRGFLAAAIVSMGIAGPALAAPPSGVEFQTEFQNCVESIGVTLVPTDLAREMVPAGVVLVGEGTPVTPAVARTARCEGISVDGGKPKAGAIVQIGLVIVPPGVPGDIDNFTLEYYTSDAKLAERLRRAGVDAQHVPTLVYAYLPAAPGDADPFAVVVPPPGRPPLAIAGNVTASTASAGSFHANWWTSSGGALVEMSTDVPDIHIGTADLTMLTTPSSPLGRLFGPPPVTFPILQQFNTFTAAHMTVQR
jgi:hypothetical protein